MRESRGIRRNLLPGTRKPVSWPLSKQRMIVCWDKWHISAASPVVKTDLCRTLGVSYANGVRALLIVQNESYLNLPKPYKLPISHILPRLEEQKSKKLIVQGMVTGKQVINSAARSRKPSK